MSGSSKSSNLHHLSLYSFFIQSSELKKSFKDHLLLRIRLLQHHELFFSKNLSYQTKKMQKCKKQQRNVLWVRKKNPFLSIFYFKFPISLTIWVWKQIIKDKGPVGRKIKIIQFESTLLFIFILYFRIRTFFFKNFVSFFFIEEENMRKFISEKVL